MIQNPQSNEQLLLDVRVNGNVAYDFVSQQQYLWGTVSNDLFTNGTTTMQFFRIYYNGAWKFVYFNKNCLWAGSSPNPPTAGLCPYYLGFGLRFKARFYCTTHTNDKEPFATLSHNNTAYRGYCLIWRNGWVWSRCKTTYDPTKGINESISFVESSIDPMTIQWDFNENYNRFKVFDYNNALKYDSGLDTNISGMQYRILPLMVGNWNGGNQCNPTCYYEYIKYINGDSVSDFLS